MMSDRRPTPRDREVVAYLTTRRIPTDRIALALNISADQVRAIRNGECTVASCHHPVKARSFCAVHYGRHLRAQTGRGKPCRDCGARGNGLHHGVCRDCRTKVCTIDGCTGEVRGLGYCKKHWTRHNRTGYAVCRDCGTDAAGGGNGRCLACGRKHRSLTAPPPAALLAATPRRRDSDEPHCPLGCGRPIHHTPAIAAPSIGLQSCQGTPKRHKEIA